MDEILKRDQNFIVVLGGVTDDANEYIRMFRVDPATGALLISAAGLGTGTVTSIAAGTGILATPDPITTTGTIALATSLQPMATLAGNSLKYLRVNVGETAVEYATISGGGTVDSVVGTADRITVNSTDPANPVVDIAATYVGQTSITTLGTVATGTWNATTIALAKGGTGLTSISALSIWVANVANTLVELSVTAGQSIRLNGAGNAWEAFTPSAAVPTAITVANEASDTSCFLAFFTAATGDLGPKTNANMTFDSSTGIVTFASAVLTTADINGGTIDATVIGGTTPAAVTSTIVVVDNITIDLNTISSTSGNLNIAPVAGSAIVLDGTISVDAGVVTGITSLGVTGTRVTAGFFTDLTVTNAISGSVTGNAGTASAVAVGGITGLGTGVATALAINVGSAGAFVTFNGAGGTPSSLTLTNATGLPAAAILPGTLAAGVYLLAENASIGLDPAGSADGKYTGITMTGISGYSQAFGDLVYLDAATSRWKAADADAAATADRMLAMVVVAGTDGNACTLLLQGQIRADAKFPALTIGSPVYVGEAAGEIQVAIPTGADNVIKRVGFALTADEIYFCPSTDAQTTVA